MSTDPSAAVPPPARFAAAVFPRIAGRSPDADRELASARVRGYAAGHAEGMRAAAAAADLMREEAQRDREQERVAGERAIALSVGALEAAALSLAERERQLADAAQRTLERLAVDLAEVVVARELADGEDSARAALRRALAEAPPAEVREVRLSTADLETLRAQDAVPSGIALTADGSLSPGDAVVVVPDGSVDARIRAAFDRARAALGDRAGERGAP
ncbi:FliH/SctL family protein [Microbacterium marinilacus]|uniref:Flagellar assembly protein FliH/Type III secretion system HrpE domain-containing protein n=1 Tax=Microbacterium marinilacus TaxID=415209 RepID=A0ABP7B6C0_9MICO|nr:FliH/SctL family protein [Microbacterium marinilacus]MBY0687731.1 hypothetical protein [Microbacterium marinilacus]